jgi:hypothetical protein
MWRTTTNIDHTAALGQASPLRVASPAAPAADMRIVRVDRLGGLIHEYAQVA